MVQAVTGIQQLGLAAAAPSPTDSEGGLSSRSPRKIQMGAATSGSFDPRRPGPELRLLSKEMRSLPGVPQWR